MRLHQAPFSHAVLKDSNYSQVLFLCLYVTQARRVTRRCCNHCTCASCWGSIMQASPMQDWAAGETDGRRVRLPLLVLTLPGQGQEAHGNSSTIKSVRTRRSNPHPPLHKIRGYTIHSCVLEEGGKIRKRYIEFQTDLMKCLNFHISNHNRTWVIKNSLICWQVTMKSSSFFFFPLPLIQRLYYRHYLIYLYSEGAEVLKFDTMYKDF